MSQQEMVLMGVTKKVGSEFVDLSLDGEQVKEILPDSILSDLMEQLNRPTSESDIGKIESEINRSFPEDTDTSVVVKFLKEPGPVSSYCTGIVDAIILLGLLKSSLITLAGPDSNIQFNLDETREMISFDVDGDIDSDGSCLKFQSFYTAGISCSILGDRFELIDSGNIVSRFNINKDGSYDLSFILPQGFVDLISHPTAASLAELLTQESISSQIGEDESKQTEVTGFIESAGHNFDHYFAVIGDLLAGSLRIEAEGSKQRLCFIIACLERIQSICGIEIEGNVHDTIFSRDYHRNPRFDQLRGVFSGEQKQTETTIKLKEAVTWFEHNAGKPALLRESERINCSLQQLVLTAQTLSSACEA
jgi:hypothetical protein